MYALELAAGRWTLASLTIAVPLGGLLPLSCADMVKRYKPQLTRVPLQLHSLMEVAEAAGVNQKYIRRRFPDKAREVAQASRSRKRQDSAYRAKDRMEAYCRAHHEVLARGESPTRRRVLAHLEISGVRLGSREVQ